MISFLLLLELTNGKLILELFCPQSNIQGVIECCTDILITSYWLHVELGKNIKKILCQKIK
jgi:hypothetical protein